MIARRFVGLLMVLFGTGLVACEEPRKPAEPSPYFATAADDPPPSRPSRESSCPAPGKRVPLTKVMNPSFIKRYEGCDVEVEADFLKMGNEGYSLGPYDTNANTTFQVLAPGTSAQQGFGGQGFGTFCGIPKEQADPLFELKQGDRIRLRGAPVGSYAAGQLIVGVFHATAVEVVNKEEGE